MFLLQDTVSVHRPGFYAQRFKSYFADKVFRKIPSRKPNLTTLTCTSRTCLPVTLESVPNEIMNAHCTCNSTTCCVTRVISVASHVCQLLLSSVPPILAAPILSSLVTLLSALAQALTGMLQAPPTKLNLLFFP